MSLPRPSRKITQEKETDAPLRTKHRETDYRPSDVFRFEPQPDITVQELAYLLMVLYEPAIHFKNYLNLPDNVQRHFRPTKI